MDAPTKRAFYLGRYNCIESIGQGPLGETFRAKIYGVAGFEKQFAVKRLPQRLCDDEELVARFVNAATAYAALDHERIARVHEVNVQGAQYYIAIDLVRGLDLQRLFEILQGRGEALPTDVALLVALDVAEALESAHARRDLLPGGVLHLGLAPHAVMVTTDGEVRLLDVGLLGSLVRLGWADDDTLLPTLGYLPPELLRADPVDARADVFSLGALLYELLSGKRAFPGDRAREVRRLIEAASPEPPAADPRLQGFLALALAADPAARPPSMSSVREALAPILGSRGTRARHELGAIVRRLARPVTRTGAFPVVAMPTAPPPPVSPPDRRWQPPLLRSNATHPEPPAKPAAPPLPPSGPSSTSASAAPPSASASPPPPPPIGPQLSTIPPRNTFAGVGPDDQVLVPIELVELPGAPTAPEMPAVSGDPAAAPADPLDSAITAPVQKSAPDRASEAAAPPPIPNSAPSPLAPPIPPSVAPLAPPIPPSAAPPAGPPVATALAPSSSPVAPAKKEGSLRWVGLLVAVVALGSAAAISVAIHHSKSAAPSVSVEVPRPPAPAAPAIAPIAPARPAPPTPAAPAVPTLDIITTPVGATIFVDGEPRGPSPLHLTIASGRHRVVALADGFLLRHETVEVPDAARVDWTLAPARLPAELAGDAGLKVRCKTQGELRIFVDGADSGRQCPNDERISVKPGPHKIGLYSPRTEKTVELEHEVEEANYSTRVYTRY
ncbi:MAG TPA: serine/threonine-protein kinase [Polyangia bacterium]